VFIVAVFDIALFKVKVHDMSEKPPLNPDNTVSDAEAERHLIYDDVDREILKRFLVVV
jgi:hypothetical protein